MRYLLKVLYISHPVFKDDRHDQKSTAAVDFKREIKCTLDDMLPPK